MIATTSPPVRADQVEDFSSGPLPTIDLVDQLALEQQALRAAAMPAMREAIENTKAKFRKHRLGQTPEGKDMIDSAATNLSLYSMDYAVVNDTRRPMIKWWQSTPHQWFGLNWPGSRFGIDSPDNFYRIIMIDGESEYEIYGQRTRTPPAQETFVLYNRLPHESTRTIEGADYGSAISDRDMIFKPDGSFIITVGPGPGNPGTNHLRTTPDAKFITIRDTLSNWEHQRPNALRVRRIAGPPAAPPRTDEQIAQEAAKIMTGETDYWIKFFDEVEYAEPVNTIPTPVGRSGGWGYISTGWFELADDEAWIFTLNPLSAKSLGFQVSDVWGVATEYVHHTSSMNMAQCKPNPDGTYTFVVAPKDPGVWNWVDTAGMHIGMFTLRWQQLSDHDQIVGDNAIRESRVVKLAQLKELLPVRTVWIDAEERRQQQADRAASFTLRFHQ